MPETNLESVLDERDIGEGKTNFPLQKDHPLLVIWKSDLSLQELKIIDVYLTMTNIRSRRFSMKKMTLKRSLMYSVSGQTCLKSTCRHCRCRLLMSTRKREEYLYLKWQQSR